MRFAPGPSGPLHVGHSRAAVLNDEYVRRYGGRYILRLEDTDPARVMLEATFYRPISYAPKVNCPVLFVVADRDLYVPAEAAVKTAGLIPRAEVVRLPVGHFDVYVGEWFETAAEAEADFLEKHLLG